jgi:hypothetical protein
LAAQALREFPRNTRLMSQGELPMRKFTNMLLLALLLFVLAACSPFGGGGDDDDNGAPVPALNAGEQDGEDDEQGEEGEESEEGGD